MKVRKQKTTNQGPNPLEVHTATAQGSFEEKVLAGAGGRELVTDVGPPELQLVDTDIESHDEHFQRKQAAKDGALRRAKAVKKSGRPRKKAARLAPRARAVARGCERKLIRYEFLSKNYIELEGKIWAHATRELSDRAYRLRKVGLGIGDLVGVSLAYALALDTSPLEAFLLAGGTVVALVIGGDLGGQLRLQTQRRALAAQVAAGHVPPTDEVARECTATAPRWAPLAWSAAAMVFGVAGLSVGVLRSGGGAGGWVAAAMAVLTLCITVAAGVTSWRHANLYADVLDSAGRRLKASWRELHKLAKHRSLARLCGLVERIAVILEVAWHEVAARFDFGEATAALIKVGNAGAFGHGTHLPEGGVDGPGAAVTEPTGFFPREFWKAPHFVPAPLPDDDRNRDGRHNGNGNGTGAGNGAGNGNGNGGGGGSRP